MTDNKPYTIPASDDVDPFEGMSDEDIDDLLEVFFEDTSEKLDELSQLILDLEESADSDSVCNQMLQVYHSVKGTGGTFGFQVVTTVAHKFESLIESVKKSPKKIDSLLIDGLLKSLDLFKNLTDSIRDRKPTVDLEQEILNLAEQLATKDNSSVIESGVDVADVKITRAETAEAKSKKDDEYVKLKVAKIDKIVALTSELSLKKHSGKKQIVGLRDLLNSLKRTIRNGESLQSEVSDFSAQLNSAAYNEKFTKKFNDVL